MKTLKEAYESVGLTMQNGDRIKSADPKHWHRRSELINVDGDYYQLSDEVGYGIFRKATAVAVEDGVLIWRGKKQIYPKVNNQESRRILDDLGYRLTDENLATVIDQLIDAKIKEAMK